MSQSKNILLKLFDTILYKPKENYSFVLEENKYDFDSTCPDNKKSNNESKKPSILNSIFNKNKNVELPSSIKISSSLDNNLEVIKKELNYPQNSDIKIREFILANTEKTKAFCVYVEPITDSILMHNIFESLMVPRNFERAKMSSVCDLIPDEIVRNGDISKKETIDDAINSMISGQSLFFLDNCSYVLCAETKNFVQRSIGKPSNETDIVGPKESFVESIRTNLSMIRRIFKSKSLIIEKFSIGNVNNNTCFVMYQKDIANESLVEEVKRRISSIKIDFIHSIGALEQCIEDNPYSIFPLAMTTERPDRVCSGISDGKVAIMLDNCPFAMVVPSTVSSHLQTIDDTDSRFIYASFIRIFRTIGIILSLLLPALYVALVNYHQDMLPTDLLISIDNARESVPFPTIVEVILLDILFEVIREASIRVPGIMGSTIGIVGALILGQAAVQANLVSPILVVIIAATGIGSFSVPNNELEASLRMLRFAITFSAYLLGFYGISIALFIIAAILCSEKSFGVPIFAPFAPLTSDSTRDSSIRFPIWWQNTRPDFLQPQKKYTMEENLRKWDKKNPDNRKE